MATKEPLQTNKPKHNNDIIPYIQNEEINQTHTPKVIENKTKPVDSKTKITRLIRVR